jgi:hypothetical protein
MEVVVTLWVLFAAILGLVWWMFYVPHPPGRED